MPSGFFTYTRGLQRKEFNFENHTTEKFCSIGSSLYRHSIGNVQCGRSNKNYLLYWFVSSGIEHWTYILLTVSNNYCDKIDTTMIRIKPSPAARIYIVNLFQTFPNNFLDATQFNEFWKGIALWILPACLLLASGQNRYHFSNDTLGIILKV